MGGRAGAVCVDVNHWDIMSVFVQWTYFCINGRHCSSNFSRQGEDDSDAILVNIYTYLWNNNVSRKNGRKRGGKRPFPKQKSLFLYSVPISPWLEKYWMLLECNALSMPPPCMGKVCHKLKVHVMLKLYN